MSGIKNNAIFNGSEELELKQSVTVLSIFFKYLAFFKIYTHLKILKKKKLISVNLQNHTTKCLIDKGTNTTMR